LSSTLKVTSSTIHGGTNPKANENNCSGFIPPPSFRPTLSPTSYQLPTSSGEEPSLRAIALQNQAGDDAKNII
jgi:hypothetical protein